MDKFTTILVIVLAILVLYVVYTKMYEGFSDGSTNTAKYNIQFITMWGADESINHPNNPHTGNMFLITHNNRFRLFEVGKLASKGVSNTSMYGTLDDLFDITENNGDIGNTVTSGVLMAPGEANLTINADANKHTLSFVTMVAPSSDWFTGFSLNLMENGKWITKKMIPLYVYISGTDSNQGFVTEHKLREHPQPIKLKNDKFLYPDGKLKPIAYAIITKAN